MHRSLPSECGRAPGSAQPRNTVCARDRSRKSAWGARALRSAIAEIQRYAALSVRFLGRLLGCRMSDREGAAFIAAVLLVGVVERLQEDFLLVFGVLVG